MGRTKNPYFSLRKRLEKEKADELERFILNHSKPLPTSKEMSVYKDAYTTLKNRIREILDGGEDPNTKLILIDQAFKNMDVMVEIKQSEELNVNN